MSPKKGDQFKKTIEIPVPSIFQGLVNSLLVLRGGDTNLHSNRSAVLPPATVTFRAVLKLDNDATKNHLNKKPPETLFGGDDTDPGSMGIITGYMMLFERMSMNQGV